MNIVCVIIWTGNVLEMTVMNSGTFVLDKTIYPNLS